MQTVTNSGNGAVAEESYKIGMVSLGCPKNQVDAEQMLGALASSGFEITPDQYQADLIVVNTCGFIESAKEESIEAVLEAAKMKTQGKCRRIIIAGCLAQRYKDELLRELPEADVVIGTGGISRISSICRDALSGKDRFSDVPPPSMVYGLPRISTTPIHYRYLKIAEGCSNRCSYCAIPLIRGNFASRPFASILDEARGLADEGARELVLLAQDSTAYRDGAADLPALLRALTRVPGIEWVRLMYAYPGRISDELMNVMAEESGICKYLDIPIQHFDDQVLLAMNRRGTSSDIRATVDRLRERVPGIALRTSVIVGFPGETEAAFKRLLAYVKSARFEHLGVFTYSSEEGTAAYDLEGAVPKEVAADRLHRVMTAQAKISLEANRALIGSRQRVLVDGMEDMVLMGRLQTQAPDIDGMVYLSEIEAAPGDFVDVTITGATEYELTGTPEPKQKPKGVSRKDAKTQRRKESHKLSGLY